MKTLLILLFSLFTSSISAQNPEITKDTLSVQGNCGDCKSRIENAALIKGVKFAEWNKDTDELYVVYKNTKVSREEILKSVANAGHKNEAFEESKEAYAKLPGCCQYLNGKASCEKK